MANPIKPEPHESLESKMDRIGDRVQEKAKETQEQAREAAAKVRSTIDRLASSDQADKVRKLAQDVSGRAEEYYDQASSWVEENRLVSAVGLFAVGGLIGFFIGRTSKSNL